MYMYYCLPVNAIPSLLSSIEVSDPTELERMLLLVGGGLVEEEGLGLLGRTLDPPLGGLGLDTGTVVDRSS